MKLTSFSYLFRIDFYAVHINQIPSNHIFYPQRFKPNQIAVLLIFYYDAKGKIRRESIYGRQGPDINSLHLLNFSQLSDIIQSNICKFFGFSMFLFLPNIIVIPNQSISHTFFFSSCIYRSLLFDSSEYTYFRFASYSAPRKLKNFVVQSGVFFAINFPILNIYKVNIGEYIDMERGILCSDT